MLRMYAKDGKELEQLECSYTPRRNVKWTNLFGKEIWCFLKKLNITVAFDSGISIIGIYPREMKLYILTRDLYMNVHTSFMCNSQKVDIN